MTPAFRHAYALLGLMTLIVFGGAFLVLSKKAEAPDEIISGNKITMSLTLTSPAFKEGELIPSKYTCDGENVSPEIHIENIPEGTVSLALVMDDPDIPDSVKQSRGIEKFDHWVVYNIPPDTRVIPMGEIVGALGLNSKGEATYTGPCPPDREHRYIFRLYALSSTLNFIQTPKLYDVEETARGMMVESAELIGKYERMQITQ